MDETENTQDQTSAPQEIQVTDRQGNTVNLPAARVAELAGLGLDFESRHAELEAERQSIANRQSEMEQDSRGLEGYRQLRAAIDMNPAVGQAVSQAIHNPDAVLRALQEGGVDDYDQDGGGDGVNVNGAPVQPQIPREILQELGTLKSAMSALAKSDQARNEQQRAQDLVTSVETELQAFPWLTGKMRDNVQRASLMQLAQPGNTDGATVIVAREAGLQKEAWEEAQAQNSKNHRNRLSLRTASPDAAPGGVRPPDKLDKESFKNGKLNKNLKAALDDFLGAGQGL